MKLLIITQVLDRDDPVFGFFHQWVEKLAQQFDKVSVIALAEGSYDLPSNVSVYSLGKEKGSPKIFRALKFYRLLFTLVPESSGILAHMSPVFAVASWPVAALYKKRIILWYLHRSVTMRLKLAEMLCYKIATASKESLQLKSTKIAELGHGIDADHFKTNRSVADWHKPLRIISVGRISRIKNYETLIRAVRTLREKGFNFDVNIVGSTVTSDDLGYLKFLKALVSQLGLEDMVHFTGRVPYSSVARYYKEADIMVNLTPRGGLDKAVLEAMASGCVIFTSNPVFAKDLGDYSAELIFEHGNSGDLAAKMTEFFSWIPEMKSQASIFMERSVREHHDLGNFIMKLSGLFSGADMAAAPKPFRYYKVLARVLLLYVQNKLFLKKPAAILMYHSIAETPERFAVTPEDFKWQMNYLHKHRYHVVSLDDLVKQLENGQPVKDKTVVLTFDDGYEDNYLTAFSVLQKYNFPATVFLVTGWIGNKDYTNRRGVKLPILDWEQIGKMHDSGLIDFQPHTVSHPMLSEVPLEKIRTEMEQSKKEIEERLNKKCRLFAYPWGVYNHRVADTARTLFSASVTVARGFVGEDDDLIILKRNSVDSWVGKFVFRLKIQ